MAVTWCLKKIYIPDFLRLNNFHLLRPLLPLSADSPGDDLIVAVCCLQRACVTLLIPCFWNGRLGIIDMERVIGRDCGGGVRSLNPDRYRSHLPVPQHR